MAKLSDLPQELLLEIISLLRSNEPAKKRMLEASLSKNHNALARALHRERYSVISLSSTCKALHEKLKAEKYRFVSIHGHNGAQKLLSLLRLMRARPEIGSQIRRLNLQLAPLARGVTMLSYDQLRSMKAWADTIGVVVDDAVLTSLLSYEIHGDVNDPKDREFSIEQHNLDGACLRILYGILCHYLQDVREISLSTSPDLFSAFPNQLIFQRPMWPRNSSSRHLLPGLRSLAFETSKGGWQDGFELAKMAEVVGGVPEVYLRGCSLYTTKPAYSNNSLHSLVLQDTDISCDFLKSCKSLSRFIYLRTGNVSDSRSLPSPRRIKKALKSSRHSLKTLCFSCGPKPRNQGASRCFDSFKKFPCLENLWIDTWSCRLAGGDDDQIDSISDSEMELYYDAGTWPMSNLTGEGRKAASANRLIKSLPPSLRRLHISGPVTANRIYGSMTRLSTQCSGGTMRGFKELAVDGLLDSGTATSELRSAFREAGVKICKVDKDIVMW
ncbi:hypothetical protein LX32DRAFT_721195 [Colletotrichum zoysiae]|uniref:F-box domain-containing protein n=1 Tax=Colletotrichum zoysiae TaxID=1216348 RepID=A0AAD9HH58_9PEZI|nr:hypothetical protein LX32DRAFT_721195 [Colletotrichum zoysiae]